MSDKIEKINQSLQKIEDLIATKSLIQGDNTLFKNLEEENNILKQEYQTLKETSQEVINELNHSIQIIEDYFKKQNANSKNT